MYDNLTKDDIKKMQEEIEYRKLVDSPLFCRLPPFYGAINFLIALFMLLSMILFMLSHAAEQF